MPEIRCDDCNRTFERGSALSAHLKSKGHLKHTIGINDENSKICEKCNNRFMLAGYKIHNMTCKGMYKPKLKTLTAIEDYRNLMNDPKIFDEVYRTFVVGEEKRAPYDLETYLNNYKDDIKTSMGNVLKDLNFLKFKLIIRLTYVSESEEGNFLDTRVVTPFIILVSLENFEETFEDIIEEVNSNYEIVEQELGDSSLKLYSINEIQIDYWKTYSFNPKSYVKLPFKSTYLVNIKNDKKYIDDCFSLCIAAHKHPAKDHVNRILNYVPYLDELNFGDIKKPIDVKDIPKFEKLNNLRIDVYILQQIGEDETKRASWVINPFIISKSEEKEEVSLLLYENHWILITDFQGFALSQFSNKHSKGQHVCKRCFHVSTSELSKEKHYRLCILNQPARIIMPKKDKAFMKFNNFKNIQKPLVNIYSDFEAVNLPQNKLHQYIDFIHEHNLLDAYNNFKYEEKETDNIQYFNNYLIHSTAKSMNLSKVLAFIKNTSFNFNFPKYLSKYAILNRCLEFIINNNLKLADFTYVQKETDEIIPLIHETEKYNLTKIEAFLKTCDKPFTIKLFNQKASAYSIYVKSNYPNLYQSKTFYYRGKSNEDTLENFVKTVNELEKTFYQIIQKTNYLEVDMSEEQELNFRKATKCWMCDKDFEKNPRIDLCNPTSHDKVRDHDHFLEKNNYRGAAHESCNINCKRVTKVPFFFHNMTNYDIHLFIKALAVNTPKRFKPIGKTKEKYKAVTYGCLKFVDSLSLLNDGLDAMATTLSDKTFKILIREYLYPKLGFKIFTEEFSNFLKTSNITSIDEILDIISQKSKDVFSEIFKLCRAKGIYPYDYTDSFEKYESFELPPKEKFYSILNQKNITDEEYERAKQIWKLFDCKTFGDYTDVYLNFDVYILADCFEEFISRFYPLNPSNYISSPSLAWDVLLHSSQITLDLLTDLDMFNLIKHNIRGGISSVLGNRKIKSCNIRTLQQDFKIVDELYYYQLKGKKEVTKEDCEDIIKSFFNPSYILYIDATALYSGIMTQPMPYKNFKWEEIDKIETVLRTEKDSKTGYFVECDLEYPKEIHEKTKHFPFCPINRQVRYDELTKWQQIIAKRNQSRKLICDQNDKENYLVHYRLLQFYLKHGMKLKKVHSIISFKQKCWMKNYIENNIKLRQEAAEKKDDFGVKNYKALNNSVFGKTMENTDKYRDIRLVTDLKEYMKIISKPTVKDIHKYSKDLISMEIQQYEKIYNKPMYIGFTILELSKLQMYETYYDILKPYFEERISLHYMDTDSMVLHLKSEDLQKELKETPVLAELINTSGDLFTFKDEKPVVPIDKAIFTRSKQYFLKCEKFDPKKDVRSKGCKKCVAQQLRYEDFEKCLATGERLFRVMHKIRSDKFHDLYLEEQNKLVLNNYDDKRAILSDGIHTLPYGNYKLEVIKNLDGINKILKTSYTDLDIYNLTTLEYLDLINKLISSHS